MNRRKRKRVVTSNSLRTTTQSHTLLPDIAEATSVEDVVNEDQCVLAVLASDCAMLKIQ